MPGPHADFLSYISTMPSLRSYILEHPSDTEVTAAYNACILQLKRFRDIHIQIVTRYIILPSTKSAPQQGRNKLNLAIATTLQDNNRNKAVYGTGGTQLIPFLRQTRDETAEAVRAE
jgi:indoleamine 2,3-dioxygenase